MSICSSPLSENTSPLHMTRVRPVWDNLCKQEGVVPFLTINNTATYNYNQHLQSSINGLADTCCFLGTCTPQVKNITRLIKCHNPKEHFSFSINILTSIKGSISLRIASLYLLFWHRCTSIHRRSCIIRTKISKNNYTLYHSTIKITTTTTLHSNCICYSRCYLFSELLWILLSKTAFQPLETCF